MAVLPEHIIAVVLAGGLGTRIRHVLGDLPKPMAPVEGKPFLEWVVRRLAIQGIRHVRLSTGHRAEVIERHFHNQPVPETEVCCVQETSPMGTAGGFLNVIREVAHPPAAWLVLNGDSLVLAQLDRLLTVLNDRDVNGGLLGIRMSDASRYGTIDQTGDGRLVGFREKRPGAGIINAGVYLFRSSVVEQFPNKSPLSFETEVFTHLIQHGARLKVCVEEAPFLDIGTPESLAEAEQFIRNNRGAFEDASPKPA